MHDVNCFHCSKMIHITVEKYKMFAVDNPYLNLFLHTDCIAEIEKNGDLYQYLTEKVVIMYNNELKEVN